MTRLIDCSNGDVRKPLYFIDLYDEILSSRTQTVKTVLEIGVQSGGCLAMWRNYFPHAEVHGVDIGTENYQDRGDRTHLHIGDQKDVDFLEALIKEIGSPDVIVDDGGHRMSEQITSFNTLFPLMKSGGVYAIEDIFTSYDHGWFHDMGDTTTIEYLKQLADTLSYGYTNLLYGPGEKPSHMHIKSIQFYDCIVFIMKDSHA